MLSNSMERRAGAEGFSLLELMIAVTIVGILAAVAVPGYFNHMMRSRQTAVVGELMAIKAAQERYFAENGGYAAKMNKLQAGASPVMYAVGGTYTNGDYQYWITPNTSALITDGTIKAKGDPNHDGTFTDEWEVSIDDLNDKPQSTASNEGFAWSSLASLF